MKRCPITYEEISDQENYSRKGLKSLSVQLNQLAHLDFSAEEQREEAIARVGKMSIQGVQLKLSARLKIKEERFDIVDHHGDYILKPQSEYYLSLPENEALTMSLAASIGIEVPLHGLVYSKDGSMTYFIKRFDRIGHHSKLPIEDFAQLSQQTRDTKYNSSMEKVIKIVVSYCTFPKIEAVKLFKLTLFNFLVGNEDMHLKNFSLITRGKITTLSPAYDLLNTTIAQKNSQEELALPLNGKKHNLTLNDFIKYFGLQQLELNQKIISGVIHEIQQALPYWKDLITHSFLPPALQEKYLKLLAERCQRLGLTFL